MTEFPQVDIQQVLEEMVRKSIVPQGFTPLSRMSLRELETIGVSVVMIMCISWHGKSKIKDSEVDLERLSELFVLRCRVVQTIFTSGDHRWGF